MGKAEDWQARVEREFSGEDDEDIILLNPRRDDWDSSWVQDPTPGTQFHEQVSWELESQDMSDVIVYYFDDDTQSPITMLELGLYADVKPIIVRCTSKFWRYGNVKMVCDKFYIPCVESFDDFIREIRKECG